LADEPAHHPALGSLDLAPLLLGGDSVARRWAASAAVLVTTIWR